MKNVLLFTSLLIINFIYGQNDIKADNLLNKVSEKIDEAKSYQIDFTYTLENKFEGINQDSKGSIIIKDDSYVLNFMGLTQICDSNYIYTIVKENEEVIISSMNDEEQQTIRPSQLLDFYRSGYMLLWDRLEINNNDKVQFVKLIPIDSNSEISHLFLGVNISNFNISKLVEIGKNKTKTILKVNNINYNPTIDEKTFVFDKSNYENYYIETL